MVSICTSSFNIKFAYVYAQEGRVWLQVTAFFLIERRKILIKILIKIFERCRLKYLRQEIWSGILYLL